MATALSGHADSKHAHARPWAWHPASRPTQEPLRTVAAMRFFVRRRLIGAGVTLAALGGVWLWAERLRVRLESPSFFTGWLLLASLGLLALFQVRKKLPAPPLGSAAAWMQIHIYTGLATAGLYLIHTPLRWPNGVLE